MSRSVSVQVFFWYNLLHIVCDQCRGYFSFGADATKVQELHEPLDVFNTLCPIPIPHPQEPWTKGWLIRHTSFYSRTPRLCQKISLCRRMLGSNPVLLRLWHWQPDALTTLGLICQKLLIYHQMINVTDTWKGDKGPNMAQDFYSHK